MKKLLLFVTITFLGFQEGFGQNSPWTFGVKTGMGQSGLMKTEVLDHELKDVFKPGFNYGFGLRSGYRFLNFFTATVDLEWQHVGDKRVRTMDFFAQGDGRIVNTIKFDNKFQRVQLPVALQFSPFSKTIRPYAKGGFAPSYILSGSFARTFTSTRNNTLDHEHTDADFDLPPNKDLRRQTLFFAGIGVAIGKHWSVEAVHHFARRMNYVTRYTPQLFVLWPTYYSYALRGTQLSLVYHVR
jgi:hypothetical protein